MNDKEFVDTNILIYAHDSDAGEKRLIAAEQLSRLWQRNTGVLSMQVLQEFYVNSTRKIPRPLSKPDAHLVIDTYLVWCVDPDKSDLETAFRIESAARISFWDALICASALRSGAGIILSEDLNAGQEIAGLEIVNPFARLKNAK